MKFSLPSSFWKYGVSLILTFTAWTPLFAQPNKPYQHFELGFTIGPSNFLGDLGGKDGKGTFFFKDNNIQMTKMTVGAFATYHVSPLLAFRGSLSIGSLAGDDAVIKGKGGLEEYRKIRNSNFKSSLFEGLVMAEIYPTTLLEYDVEDAYHKLRPYFLMGLGMFRFNPKGLDPLTGEWVALQPLSTEGQGFAEYPSRSLYSLTSINIPLGIGLKYQLNEKMNISFEFVHRQTFTDYIDDVSTNYIDPNLFYNYFPTDKALLAERMANKTGTPSSPIFNDGDKRGNPTKNDSYYSAQFKIGFRLGNKLDRWGATRCPVF